MSLILDIQYQHHGNVVKVTPDNFPHFEFKVNRKLEPGKVIFFVGTPDGKVIGILKYVLKSGYFYIHPHGPTDSHIKPSLLGPGIDGKIDFPKHFEMAVQLLFRDSRQMYGNYLEQVWYHYVGLFSEDEEPPLSVHIGTAGSDIVPDDPPFSYG